MCLRMTRVNAVLFTWSYLPLGPFNAREGIIRPLRAFKALKGFLSLYMALPGPQGPNKAVPS